MVGGRELDSGNDEYKWTTKSTSSQPRKYDCGGGVTGLYRRKTDNASSKEEESDEQR